MNKPKVVAIIPARGGSKGIPRKNIKLFAGAPLIAYSIAAGLQAETVDRVIVSTDDEEIAAVARAWGAETPFMRPAEFAQDQTTDLPVFEHALSWLAEHEGYTPEIVVQLRPTSPVRPPACVDDAVRLLLAHPEADSVRGVVPSGQNPFKMWTFGAGGSMHPLLTVPGVAEAYNAPRQQLPDTYWQTGHIDAIRSAAILERHSMSGAVIFPLLLDPRYTVDIDTPADWAGAEALLRQPGLPVVRPAQTSRPFPAVVRLVVFDFDGVFTDNRVWVDENGVEMVAASRADGMGISLLRKAGVEMVVLSTEANPVVSRRCEKMKIPVRQGLSDKATILRQLLDDARVPSEQVVYLGNDVNDMDCFPLVGCAITPADAHPAAIQAADLVLQTPGGMGAVRELCDMILAGRK